MVDVIEGPLVWIAGLIFVVGLVFEGWQFWGMTRKKVRNYPPLPPSPQKERKRWDRWITRALASFKGTLWQTDPVMMVSTTVFHVAVVATPLLLLGHNLLLRQAVGVSLWSLPEAVTDGLTVLVLLGVVFLGGRRLLVRRVRAITTGYDYLMLLVVAAPFVTGFLVYHQFFSYRTVLFLHILSGEVMLVALPFTKLSHMLYFFLYRFLIGSEYSFSRGARSW